jgi:hypothetical protein
VKDYKKGTKNYIINQWEKNTNMEDIGNDANNA